MDNSELSPSSAEGPELEAYFAQLYEHFATNADAPVGSALAEFVDVIDLSPTPQPAASSPTTSRRPKMLTGIGAFVATTTGKIVLGTTVAAASVGGMHAADVVDIPLLPEPAQAEVLMVDAEESPDVEAEIEEVEAAAGVEADTPVIAESDDDSSEDGDGNDEAGDGEGDEPKNHGDVVSEFATTTELEGCEKGQAIAELARSKDKKKDADDDRDDAEESAESDGDAIEDEESSKCKAKDDSDDDESDDDESDDDESDDEESDEDDDDSDDDGPPEGKGHNRDDHPGKGNSDD